MNRLKFFALAAMAFALFATTQAAANVLLNPGFETDAVLDAEPSPLVTDWSAFNGASTASANLAPVRSGIGSLWGPGFGAFSVPGAFQTFPANPGEIWDLQGYFLTPETLPADATNALLKIVWNDARGIAILPVEILIGTDDGPDFPGVASVPRLRRHLHAEHLAFHAGACRRTAGHGYSGLVRALRRPNRSGNCLFR